MTQTKNSRRTEAHIGDAVYWDRSRLPFQILIFLLPLIIAYEIGLAMFLRRDGDVITNEAHRTIVAFFDSFGISATGGLLLGGLLVIVVLLAWHILARERWRFSLRVTGLMLIESIVLAVPLLVIGQVIQRLGADATLAATVLGNFQNGAAARHSATGFGDFSIMAGITIAIGAGIYEELVFRMMLIAIVHTILVDIARASYAVGTTVAIVVSAAAFAFYHPLRDATGTIIPLRLAFYLAAGLYFGLVYVARGFGIVVGVHAVYDIIAISMATTAATE